jgi:hypothetical protein
MPPAEYESQYEACLSDIDLRIHIQPHHPFSLENVVETDILVIAKNQSASITAKSLMHLLQ